MRVVVPEKKHVDTAIVLLAYKTIYFRYWPETIGIFAGPGNQMLNSKGNLK